MALDTRRRLNVNYWRIHRRVIGDTQWNVKTDQLAATVCTTVDFLVHVQIKMIKTRFVKKIYVSPAKHAILRDLSVFNLHTLAIQLYENTVIR